MIYFIGDPHLNHANIIEYTGRPFADVHEMDAAIVGNWNDRVGKNDIVYLLGDFCLGGVAVAEKFFGMLNGGTIFVVTSRTHHDKAWLKRRSSFVTKTGGTVYVSSNSIEVLMPRKILLPDMSAQLPEKIVLCHFPIAVWEDKHYGSWHLHGHVHRQWSPEGGFAMNVSVENVGYAPISILEVLGLMKARGWSKGWNAFKENENVALY